MHPPHPRLNGNRGQFLLAFGVIYLAIGASYALDPGVAVVRSMAWMPTWSSVQICGIAWLLAGATAMIHAFTPIPRDRYGFMALAAWSTAWAIAWAISQALGYNNRGYISALVFATLALAVMIVAGMRNPIPTKDAQ